MLYPKCFWLADNNNKNKSEKRKTMTNKIIIILISKKFQLAYTISKLPSSNHPRSVGAHSLSILQGYFYLSIKIVLLLIKKKPQTIVFDALQIKAIYFNFWLHILISGTSPPCCPLFLLAPPTQRIMNTPTSKK